MNTSAQRLTGEVGPKIVILDSGPGIDPEERDAILQRFYRGRRTDHVAGSEVELRIVSAVVDSHGFTFQYNPAVLQTERDPNTLTGTIVKLN